MNECLICGKRFLEEKEYEKHFLSEHDYFIKREMEWFRDIDVKKLMLADLNEHDFKFVLKALDMLSASYLILRRYNLFKEGSK